MPDTPQQVEYQPEEQVTITLQAQQWNVVIACLQKGPYELVDPVLKSIAAQAQVINQLKAAEEMPTPPPPPAASTKRVNGRAHR